MNLTPSLRRVLMALDKHGDLGYADIAERAHVALSSLADGGYMKRLRVMELVRVSRWIRAECGGPPSPIFSVSPGKDARKPPLYTNAHRCRRWKKRAGYYTPEYRAGKQSNDSLAALVRITGRLTP